GLGVGGSCDGALGDGQRAVGGSDVVVGVGTQGDGDRVVADAGAGGGRGGQRVAQDVAADAAGDRRGQGRVVLAIDLGLVIRGDRSRLLGDAEGAVSLADVVVGVGTQGDGDRVVADAGAGRGRGGQRVAQDIATDAAGDRGGQGRVVLAVDLGLVVRGDRGRVLGDGQVGADESEVVVAVQRQGALLDGVGADVLTGLAGESASEGVATR